MFELNEIWENLRYISFRIIVILILLARISFKPLRRTQLKTYHEYDNYWNSFWESKDIFRDDLKFTHFDSPIIPPISPFEARKECIIKIIAKIIREKKLKSVLEIGCGSGLNLIILSQMFPEIQFYGIEPTEGGIKAFKNLIKNLPSELKSNFQTNAFDNVTIIHGDALNPNSLEEIMDLKFDLIFTSAVIEQLSNYYELFFQNIVKINFQYFLFYEEWLEANLTNIHYLNLVRWDYFRVSWNYLNKFKDLKIINRFVPGVQPSWLNYGVVFGEKTNLSVKEQ